MIGKMAKIYPLMISYGILIVIIAFFIGTLRLQASLLVKFY